MKRIFFILLYAATLFGTPTFAQKNGNHNAQIGRNLEIFSDIYRTLDLYYVDSLSADTTINWAIKSMLAHVDPFTDYYTDEDETLRQMTTGKYAGIGCVIRFNKKLNRTIISDPYEGTPSALAGLKAGDIILSINDADMLGKSTQEVSNLLRGEAGTTFKLKIKRPQQDKTLSFDITRQTIQLPSIPYYGMQSDGIGYILLSGFTEGVTQEMRQAVIDLKEQGMTHLILDLRDNPGGALNEAVNIVNLFVPKGKKVVYTKGKLESSHQEFITQREPLDTIMPIVVLVDGSSASSAEILAGSLQDMDRAVIMGSRTFGKGFVQSIFDIANNGSLKITVSRYYIPSGRCIQAYDYRNLKADGSVGTVPDSLTNVFHTQAGREVRDGGGIKPDIEVLPDSLPSFIYDIVSSDEMFDYATNYATRHGQIAPAGEFDISDEDYAEFAQYMNQSGFVANKRSETVMKLLKETAQLEGYYEDAKEEFNALENKLNNNLEQDLMRMKKEIKPYINSEIVSRYYFQKGICRQILNNDKEFGKAMELLKDKEKYQSILHP